MNNLINSVQMSFSNDNLPIYVANNSILYSIEEHLRQFRDIAPFNVLYSCWILEREEYRRRLSTVGMTYQTFSLHDASHSETILKQLAHFLGEDRIRELSPTDAWLILESAYCHDLGMVVTAANLYNKFSTMKPEELEKFSHKIDESDDYEVRASWSYLEPLFKSGEQQEAYPKKIWQISENENTEKYKNLENLIALYRSKWYEWPIHFTKAFMSLIQEYCRPKHGEMSYDMIWKEADEKSYEGLIPLRLRRIVADIAAIHTDEKENIIRKLSHEIEGIGGDYAHPRFVAELIRIGDLLDIDNNRFNQYQLAVAGNQGYSSFAHQLKHRSLNNFLITPEKIKITADFKMEDALYILRSDDLRERLEYSKETDNKHKTDTDENEMAVKLSLKAYKEMSAWLKMLHDELCFFSQSWFKIVPKGFSGSCAYYEVENPQFNGKNIENDLVDLRYHITAKRSSEIIQGSGLYEDIFVAFIREILQNSMDATKRRIYANLNKRDKHFSNPLEFYRYVSRDMEQLLIQIEFEEKPDQNHVEFKIRDQGIGISHHKLKKMQHIGDNKDYQMGRQAKEMPDWWKPTGSFGIGMQTIFYFSKMFKVTSRTEEEKVLRKMNFYSTEIGGKIDAYFIDNLEYAEKFGFGTEIKIDISLQMMRLLQQCESFGKDSDYFGEAVIYKEKIEKTIRDVRGSFGLPINLNIIDTDIEILRRENYLACCFGAYFIDLSAQNISKVPEWTEKFEEGKYRGFSCWNAKAKLLIRYRWLDESSEIPSLKLYFNEIFVNDRILDRKIQIPFFNAEVYLFNENAENFLEVNRDSFLYEKHGYIIDIVSSTHLDCLRFLLGTTKHTTIEEASQQQEYKDCIWSMCPLEMQLYYKAAKEYCQLRLNKERVSFWYPNVYWFFQNSNLIAYVEDGFSIDFANIHIEEDLWLTNTQNKYIGNVWLIKSESCEFRWIMEDVFFDYMDLAITELVCMQEISGNYTIIYKTEPRSGLPVVISSKHFDSYVRMQYVMLNRFEESKRMLLPGVRDYGLLCVDRLLNNLGTTFEKKWNSAIILPVTMKELNVLLKESDEKALELLDRSYLTDQNPAYSEIVDYIHSCGIRRELDDEQIRIAYRALLIYIRSLLAN